MTSPVEHIQIPMHFVSGRNMEPESAMDFESLSRAAIKQYLLDQLDAIEQRLEQDVVVAN